MAAGNPSLRNGTPLRAKRNKLSPKQLAVILDVHEETLRTWRKAKIGPPYYREVNRIYYYREDLEAWKQSSKWG